MPRDIELLATYDTPLGDETFELWLQHESDPWLLDQTGDVIVDGESQQSILILDLADGDNYTAQLRTTRAGRYRTGYLTGDPDQWPAASRCEFRAGELADITAPTITEAEWSRTSASAQKVTVSVTPSDTGVDLALYRDGVQVATATAPHAGSVDLVDDNPTLATEHTYTARHTQGFNTSDPSNAVDVFTGLAALTGLAQEAPTTQYYEYDLSWNDPDGADVRIEDDYLETGDFAAQDVISDPGTTASLSVQKNSGMASNGNITATFTTRARREQVLFSPTVDVSPWVELVVECDIAPDETAYDATGRPF